MECQICYTTQQKKMVVLHGSYHEVCQECNHKLRQNKITKCPFCREIINEDIMDTIMDTISYSTSYNTNLHNPAQLPNRYTRHIDAERLIECGISDQFISTIRDTLPFSYTSSFDGVDFLVETTRAYEEWFTNNIPRINV
jgi:hypothetical protein|tara:strand:- start:17 stop:436 length:420 start_codon:yes stop_codon:yes gene_type:complete